jgi:hypothetical protein
MVNSSVGTLISTAGKLFHVRIAEGKDEFCWLRILENGIWNFWSCPLVNRMGSLHQIQHKHN